MRSKFTGKKILITGGMGYLAAALISFLKDEDCQIIRLDQKQETTGPMNGAAKITYVIGDVTKLDTWQKNVPGMDMVFHFAAQTSVYFANDHPLVDHERNVISMLCLLETCRQQKLKPAILFSGTVTETGLPVKLPVDENHPDDPVTVYDLHKLMAESYLKYYSAQGIINGAILRLANVYGPGPKSSSGDRGILNMMIRKALQGDDLTLYGSGEFIRDYIHVKDVARAFLLAGANIEQVNGKHFVIGSGHGTTLKKAFELVAERVAVRTGKTVKVLSVEPPATLSAIENRNFIADSSAFKKATGWSPEYTFINGIDETIEALATA
ncbi:MAG: NAD-dependent epimerase/dehydratase family protein [bacterium]|nr:NAD-dependent epimerase/dehydratase family protein [bacterium]